VGKLRIFLVGSSEKHSTKDDVDERIISAGPGN